MFSYILHYITLLPITTKCMFSAHNVQKSTAAATLSPTQTPLKSVQSSTWPLGKGLQKWEKGKIYRKKSGGGAVEEEKEERGEEGRNGKFTPMAQVGIGAAACTDGNTHYFIQTFFVFLFSYTNLYNPHYNNIRQKCFKCYLTLHIVSDKFHICE